MAGALFSLSLEFPEVALEPGRARASLRETQQNAIRGPMRRAIQDIKQSARYQSIAQEYVFEQFTEGDLQTYAIYNTNPYAKYLIGGTTEHDIEMPPHDAPLWKLILWAQAAGLPIAAAYSAWYRIKREGQVMHHPGIKPDEAVQAILDATDIEVMARAEIAFERWAQSFGAVVGIEE